MAVTMLLKLRQGDLSSGGASGGASGVASGVSGPYGKFVGIIIRHRPRQALGRSLSTYTIHHTPYTIHVYMAVYSYYDLTNFNINLTTH